MSRIVERRLGTAHRIVHVRAMLLWLLLGTALGRRWATPEGLVRRMEGTGYLVVEGQVRLCLRLMSLGFGEAAWVDLVFHDTPRFHARIVPTTPTSCRVINDITAPLVVIPQGSTVLLLHPLDAPEETPITTRHTLDVLLYWSKTLEEVGSVPGPRLQLKHVYASDAIAQRLMEAALLPLLHPGEYIGSPIFLCSPSAPSVQLDSTKALHMRTVGKYLPSLLSHQPTSLYFDTVLLHRLAGRPLQRPLVEASSLYKYLLLQCAHIDTLEACLRLPLWEGWPPFDPAVHEGVLEYAMYVYGIMYADTSPAFRTVKAAFNAEVVHVDAAIARQKEPVTAILQSSSNACLACFEGAGSDTILITPTTALLLSSSSSDRRCAVFLEASRCSSLSSADLLLHDGSILDLALADTHALMGTTTTDVTPLPLQVPDSVRVPPAAPHAVEAMVFAAPLLYPGVEGIPWELEGVSIGEADVQHLHSLLRQQETMEVYDADEQMDKVLLRPDAVHGFVNAQEEERSLELLAFLGVLLGLAVRSNTVVPTGVYVDPILVQAIMDPGHDHTPSFEEAASTALYSHVNSDEGVNRRRTDVWSNAVYEMYHSGRDWRALLTQNTYRALVTTKAFIVLQRTFQATARDTDLSKKSAELYASWFATGVWLNDGIQLLNYPLIPFFSFLGPDSDAIVHRSGTVLSMDFQGEEWLAIDTAIADIIETATSIVYRQGNRILLSYRELIDSCPKMVVGGYTQDGAVVDRAIALCLDADLQIIMVAKSRFRHDLLCYGPGQMLFYGNDPYEYCGDMLQCVAHGAGKTYLDGRVFEGTYDHGEAHGPFTRYESNAAYTALFHHGKRQTRWEPQVMVAVAA